MKRGLVLIDHGSRRPEANAVLEAVAERVRAARPECVVRIAHMEIAPPSLAEAVAACVEAGAQEVLVCPFFLAPGDHSRSDIPRLAREAEAAHPGLRVRVSEPLGAHPGVVAALLDRAAEIESADPGEARKRR